MNAQRFTVIDEGVELRRLPGVTPPKFCGGNIGDGAVHRAPLVRVQTDHHAAEDDIDQCLCKFKAHETMAALYELK